MSAHPPPHPHSPWSLPCLERHRHSCSTVGQLLALNAPQLDALLDQIRPLPGHRTALVNFVEAQRSAVRKAQLEGMASPSLQPATSAQKSAWHSTRRSLQDASIAAKRGKDGRIAHLLDAQPLHWGNVKGPGAKPHAYVPRTRVLKVGNSRVCVYDGPMNSPSRKPREEGRRHEYDPDVF